MQLGQEPPPYVPVALGCNEQGPHRRHCYGIITDASSACSAGAGAPSNIQVLAGVAGGTLVNVMTSATNTGIGSTALSGVNTITASAAVR